MDLERQSPSDGEWSIWDKMVRTSTVRNDSAKFHRTASRKSVLRPAISTQMRHSMWIWGVGGRVEADGWTKPHVKVGSAAPDEPRTRHSPPLAKKPLSLMPAIWSTRAERWRFFRSGRRRSAATRWSDP